MIENMENKTKTSKKKKNAKTKIDVHKNQNSYIRGTSLQINKNK